MRKTHLALGPCFAILFSATIPSTDVEARTDPIFPSHLRSSLSTTTITHQQITNSCRSIFASLLKSFRRVHPADIAKLPLFGGDDPKELTERLITATFKSQPRSKAFRRLEAEDYEALMILVRSREMAPFFDPREVDQNGIHLNLEVRPEEAKVIHVFKALLKRHHEQWDELLTKPSLMKPRRDRRALKYVLFTAIGAVIDFAIFYPLWNATDYLRYGSQDPHATPQRIVAPDGGSGPSAPSVKPSL